MYQFLCQLSLFIEDTEDGLLRGVIHVLSLDEDFP